MVSLQYSRKGLHNASVLAMLAVIMLLYSTTTIYWATIVSASFRKLYQLIGSSIWLAPQIDDMDDILSSILGQAHTGFVRNNHHGRFGKWHDGSEAYPYQEPLSPYPIDIDQGLMNPHCVGTASLTVNVCLIKYTLRLVFH